MCKDKKLNHMLPDVLEEGLDVVFCGTAAGNRSAEIQQYYADSRNKFWKVIHETGFTEREFKPSEYQCVRDSGIGFTDLNKLESGVDENLNMESFDTEGLEQKVQKIKPKVLAFTSKNAGEVFLKKDKRKLSYGVQEEKIDRTEVWILPSTSGLNGQWEKKNHISYWKTLAESLKSA